MWHYSDRDRHTAGPISDEAMRRKLTMGELGPETLVWRDGMAEWQPCRTTELATSLPQAGPPPLPPLSVQTVPEPRPAVPAGYPQTAGRAGWKLLRWLVPAVLVFGIVAVRTIERENRQRLDAAARAELIGVWSCSSGELFGIPGASIRLEFTNTSDGRYVRAMIEAQGIAIAYGGTWDVSGRGTTLKERPNLIAIDIAQGSEVARLTYGVTDGNGTAFEAGLREALIGNTAMAPSMQATLEAAMHDALQEFLLKANWTSTIETLESSRLILSSAERITCAAES